MSQVRIIAIPKDPIDVAGLLAALVDLAVELGRRTDQEPSDELQQEGTAS